MNSPIALIPLLIQQDIDLIKTQLALIASTLPSARGKVERDLISSAAKMLTGRLEECERAHEHCKLAVKIVDQLCDVLADIGTDEPKPQTRTADGATRH